MSSATADAGAGLELDDDPFDSDVDVQLEMNIGELPGLRPPPRSYHPANGPSRAAFH